MVALIVTFALTGPVIVLPMALIPLFAGIGIWRGRVWSAYGLALFMFAQLVPLVFPRRFPTAMTGIIGSVVFSLFLVMLFLFAGRSLANSNAARGRAWPWIAVAALTTLPLLFVQPFVIPTGAMENTLLAGDRILVQRFPPHNPERGDIVALVYPVDRKQTFVKRIVGLPGDRIRIAGKILYRNGVRLNEPYVVHTTEYEDLYRDHFPGEPNTPVFPQAQEMLVKNVVNGELVVPPGKYFVLGDNRDMSLDSRYWGFIEAGDVIGRPLMVYDSAEQTAEQAMSGVWFRRHTRRDRLFKLL